MKAGVFLIILFIVFTRCSSGDKAAESNLMSNQDSVITININSRLQEFRIKKGTKIKFDEFQKFLNIYSGKPLKFSDTIQIDITGDGLNEQIITRINKQGIDFITYITILSSGDIIHADTLKTNDDLAFMDWYEDSVYYKLKPYSTFYDAYQSREIIEELGEDGKISDDLKEMYVTTSTSEWERLGYDSLAVFRKTDSLKEELKNYKGKFILTLEHWNRSILIWNRNTKSFDLIYSP